MSTEYTDEELVLLAIIQNIPSPMTPEKVEEKAKELSRVSELMYQGPKPEFTDSEIFNSAWNQLLTKEYVKSVGSTPNNRPIFRNNIDMRAIDEICDEFVEKQSFYSILRN